MKKSLLFWILIWVPGLLAAQPKSEWTVYGTEFSYENGKLTDTRLPVSGIMDLAFLPTGEMFFSCANYPAYFYQNGTFFETQRLMFQNNRESTIKTSSGGATTGAVDVCFDKNKSLWFLTDQGIHQIAYEHYGDLSKIGKLPIAKGVRYVADATSGMPYKKVIRLRTDTQGNVWVAGVTKDGISGISRFDGTAWKAYETPGDANTVITNLILDTGNDPLVVLEKDRKASLARFQNDKWTLIEPAIPAPVKALAVNASNDPYVATSSQLLLYKDGKWGAWDLSYNWSSVNDMVVEKNGNLWMATNSGVMCMNTQKGMYFVTSENSPLPTGNVYTIKIDAQGKKWFVTSSGIAAFKEPADLSNSQMTVYTRYNSNYQNMEIRTMQPYKNGLLLVNEEKGLYLFENQVLKAITPSEKRAVLHSEVAVDNTGTVWMGTYRYIHKYTGNNYEVWEWKDDVEKYVSHILIDDDNALWIAGKGVSRYKDNAWMRFDKKTGLSSNNVQGLYKDSKKNIWAVLGDGTACYNGTSWTLYPRKNMGIGALGMMGLKMVETSDGKFFFSNGFWLTQFDGTTFSEVPGLKQKGELLNMISDGGGGILMAIKDLGVMHFHNGTFTLLNAASGKLPSDAVSYISKDASGAYWIACGMDKPVEQPSPQAMMNGQAAAKPAPTETPKQAFERKRTDFDRFYGLVKLPGL